VAHYGPIGSLVSETAKEIAAQRGITVKQAYRHARRQLEQPPIPETFSKKDAILEALLRTNANAGVGSGSLNATIKAMGVRTNLAEQNALLWDLQKQQFIAFRESHTSSGSELSRIRLTSLGRTAIISKHDAHDTAINASRHPETHKQKVHKVGKDPTDYQNHGTVAKGDKVEIIQEAKAEPEVMEPVPYPEIHPVYFDPNPPHQNMKIPVLHEKQFGLDFTGYPVLEDLVIRRDHKRDQREKAARFVEAASLIADLNMEEADRLMTMAGEMEGPALSKLELEVLRLLDALAVKG